MNVFFIWVAVCPGKSSIIAKEGKRTDIEKQLTVSATYTKFHSKKKIAGCILGILKKLCIASTVSTIDDYVSILGFPHSSDGKESVCNAGDLGSVPGLGRSPEEGNGSPLQILAWRSPWIEEPGGLQSMGS